jgi:hypothetical protein
MEQRTCNAYVRRRGVPRPLVLVEDDTLDPATLDLSPPGAAALDIVVCTGPDGLEYCPLVADGFCPLGTPDVVVSNLSAANPWAASVQAAWAERGVPVVTASEDEPPLTWPAHVGAAIRDRWPT